MADISQSILRRLRDLYNNPQASMEQVADNLRNASRGQVAEARPSGLGMRELSMPERARGTTQAALDNLGGGGLGIIKSKGGNWLSGSVEGALKGLKKTTDLPAARSMWGDGAEQLSAWTPEELAGFASDAGSLATQTKAALRGQALNNWIEGPLTKYVKRDMATEGDPVRKLAEQGISHVTQAYPIPRPGDNTLKYARARGGLPEHGIALNEAGKAWEDIADMNIRPNWAHEIKQGWFREPDQAKKILADNPWVTGLEDKAQVFDMKGGVGDLGFNHLTDELSNALNPESGLPRQLLLTPEQMQQMGMEKAVRHVDAINKWRAAQKAEANALLAQSPAVHGVREYAENNPKGLRWVELKKAPLPEGWGTKADIITGEEMAMDPKGNTYLGARHDPRIQALAEQLKYEGDTMGHCVGGYCDDVASGKSRIFSLRDAKGEPHVTIETAPSKTLTPEKREAQMGHLVNRLLGEGVSEEQAVAQATKLYPESEVASRIVQIKGKQNKKPNDEYLPFVQDFVKNHPEGGQWGDVGDLGNTGLIKHSGKRAEALGPYSTEEELTRYLDRFPDTTQGYANGGLIPGNQETWEPVGTGYILR